MFGFIEQWLADLLGVEYDPYQLNNGGTAAIVNKSTFSHVFMAVSKIWRETNDYVELKPSILSSDIAGMKVIFHRYWMDEDILHGLTSGETKNSTAYLKFIDLGANRFSSDSFKEKIMEAFNGQALEENNSEAEEDLFEEPEPIEVKKELNDGQKLIDFLRKTTRTDVEEFESSGKHLVLNVGLTTPSNIGEIVSMSDEIDKNIIVFTGNAFSDMKPSIIKFESPSEIMKHTVIFIINPSSVKDFLIPSISSNSYTRCLGEKITSLNIVEGSTEKEIASIKSDGSLSKEEKDLRLEMIKNKPSISSYSRYDAIFRDSMTNIVWALKDRCFLYMMFPFENNKNLLNVCIKELGKRFGGKLSSKEIREIDKAYNDEISEKDKEQYVEFSIKNANSMIEKLTDLCRKAEADYKDSLAKAMEFGKVSTRLQEQISSFDNSKFAEEEKKKALLSYNETLAIPEVLSINITNNVVNVYTKNLYAMDNRTKRYHDIGTFHIMIGMLSNQYDTGSTVKIINTKHQVIAYSNKTMQAPHVFEDGKTCHGTLVTGMIEAYKRRNLFELVYQLILFLQTANTDDAAGAYINKWPMVPNEIALAHHEESEEEYKPSEAEITFDEMLAEAIPLHI